MQRTPDSGTIPVPGLRSREITVDFQGVRAIEAVTLELSQGEILALIGPNGAGKTTLVNVLTGFQRPSVGRVELCGTDISRWSAPRRAHGGLARTFQNALLFSRLSVRENVEAGALALGGSRRAARVRALEVLEWLGLAHLRDRPAGTLPFGAERRVGIGRAIAAAPRFLLMDEPAAGLNDGECEELAALIRRIRSELDCGVMLIEHRMSLVFSLCDRVQVLDRGRTLAIGSPEAIRGDPLVRRAYLGEEP